MAEYVRRETTTRRVEFAIPAPCNAAEYAKAVAAALKELYDADREIYDDTITITGTDEEIVLSYEEDGTATSADAQRIADLVSERGRQALAAFRRGEAPIRCAMNTDLTRDLAVAHRDLIEILERLIRCGATVRGGDMP